LISTKDHLMPKYELGVIGGGNMAEAILRGVIASGFIAPSAILVSEPVKARLEHLAGQLGIVPADCNSQLADCPRILLAVKPQVLAGVLDEIAPRLAGNVLVISIVAGMTAGFIAGKLAGKGRVVRSMPNTPILAGAGVSAVAAGPGATDGDVKWACSLLGSGQAGGTVVVDESMIDAVTAVSGSGPAYFCYLVEAMVAAGVAEGLPPATALELARQTCLGSGKLMAQTKEDPAGLRAKVTSPNGTTQRAIETMDSAGVKASLVKAIRAAAERSRELGRLTK
jgi:pyrroline-5-carboxylate reductase